MTACGILTAAAAPTLTRLLPVLLRLRSRQEELHEEADEASKVEPGLERRELHLLPVVLTPNLTYDPPREY